MPEEGWIAVAIVGAVVTALPLNLVIHELGHLLVALLTGLRVTGVRISLRGHSAVMVRPAGPALAVRMAALTLGGALANIGGAVLAWRLAQEALPVPIRVGLAGAAVIGVIFGVANLLPVRLRITAPDLDGRNLVRWIFRPRLTTAATTTDVARLDRTIERTRHPRVLLAAVIRRRAIDPGYPEFVAMAERLNAIARDTRTRPAHAAAISAQLALLFGIGYLHWASWKAMPSIGPTPTSSSRSPSSGSGYGRRASTAAWGWPSPGCSNTARRRLATFSPVSGPAGSRRT